MTSRSDVSLSTDAESYRIPMRISAVCCYPACPELFTFPICPRCGLPMEHEYQRYCDHCGQALDWKGLSKASVVSAPVGDKKPDYPQHTENNWSCSDFSFRYSSNT